MSNDVPATRISPTVGRVMGLTTKIGQRALLITKGALHWAKAPVEAMTAATNKDLKLNILKDRSRTRKGGCLWC